VVVKSVHTSVASMTVFTALDNVTLADVAVKLSMSIDNID